MYVAINRTIEQNKIKANKIVEMKKKMNKKNCILGKKLQKNLGCVLKIN